MSVLQPVTQDEVSHRCTYTVRFHLNARRCTYTGCGCNAFHDRAWVFVSAERCASRTWRKSADRCVDGDDCASRLLNKIKSVAAILITPRQWNCDSSAFPGFTIVHDTFRFHHYQYLKRNHFTCRAREYRRHHYGWRRDSTKRRVSTSKAAADVSPVARSRCFPFNYS